MGFEVEENGLLFHNFVHLVGVRCFGHTREVVGFNHRFLLLGGFGLLLQHLLSPSCGDRAVEEPQNE